MVPSRRSIEVRVVRMPRDEGSASLEFITTGMILLVPLIYLTLAIAAVQGGALAVEGAARQAARVYVQAVDEGAADAAARRAVEVALADHGLGAGYELAMRCSPTPGECLERLGSVTVTVGVVVSLPLVPSVLDLSAPLGIPLEATATQRVSRFMADPEP